MNLTIKKILLSACILASTCTVSFGAKKEKKVWNETLDTYFVQNDAAEVTPDAEGFIKRWLLLEPIGKPNRGNTVFTDSYIREAFSKQYFEGQMTMLPVDGQKVKAVEEVEMFDQDTAPGDFRRMMAPARIEEKKVNLTWHALDSKNFNIKLFRFAEAYERNHYGIICWAVTVINCPEDMTVRMAVGSNSASQWWVNGEEAVILSGDRRMVQDDCTSKRITLNKGRNIIRGAVINGPGMSDFCVRFLDEAGYPVKNITVSYK